MEARIDTHPSPESLKAFGLGRMDDASAQALFVHLEHCPACRRQAEEVSGDKFLAPFREILATRGGVTRTYTLRPQLGQPLVRSAATKCLSPVSTGLAPAPRWPPRPTSSPSSEYESTHSGCWRKSHVCD